MKIFPNEVIKRFWSKVNKTNTCWIWTGSVDKDGYGYFSVKGKNIKPHRFSKMLEQNKIIPSQVCILHNCPIKDNPSCVNPKHLKMGTLQENIKDRDNKGNSPKGSKNGYSKLTENQVRKIRKVYTNKKLTFTEITKICKISRTCLAGIIKNKTWRHVT